MQITLGEVVRTPSGLITRVTYPTRFILAEYWEITNGDHIREEELVPLSVGELFEIAGHPVLEDGDIVLDSGTWFMNFDDEDKREKRTSCYRFENKWVVEPGYAAVHGVDIFRLPACEVWNYLPDVVKNVVDPKPRTIESVVVAPFDVVPAHIAVEDWEPGTRVKVIELK